MDAARGQQQGGITWEAAAGEAASTRRRLPPSPTRGPHLRLRPGAKAARDVGLHLPQRAHRRGGLRRRAQLACEQRSREAALYDPQVVPGASHRGGKGRAHEGGGSKLGRGAGKASADAARGPRHQSSGACAPGPARGPHRRSAVSALCDSARQLATTKAAPRGSATGAARSGSNSISMARPGWGERWMGRGWVARRAGGARGACLLPGTR
jgi:hypothetical protein